MLAGEFAGKTEVKEVCAREFTARGTPYEIGRQVGHAFAERIHLFLRDGLARINCIRRVPLSLEEALRQAGTYAACIETALPDIAAEIGGLADGAHIRYREAILVQIRRELILSGAEQGDCTSIALQHEGRMLLSQTIDLAGGMEDQAMVLRVIPQSKEQPRICMFTFTGLCGYFGLNSAGLAVGLNMVVSPGWRAGVPVYLLIRHLLTRRSIEEALEEIGRIRRASSRYLVLADAHSAVGVEMTVDQHRVIRGLPLVHTNHFLHPEWQQLDRISGAFRHASKSRYIRAHTLALAGTPPEAILRDHEGFPLSICCHRTGGRSNPETVAAVVSDPEAGTMRVLAGRVCEGKFRKYGMPVPDEDPLPRS